MTHQPSGTRSWTTPCRPARGRWALVALSVQVLLVLLQTDVEAAEPSCKWYGVCNTDAEKPQYCPYDGPAKPFPAEGLPLLRKWCPKYVDRITSSDGSMSTCCDVQQIEALDKNIRLADQFLRGCPSCMNNFAEHFCEFTCNPQQSLFMNVTSLKDNVIGNTSVKSISGVELWITEKSIQGIYDSCKSVFVPSAGMRALDLMCGSWGSALCSPMRWFTFMGDAGGNPYVPFQVTYHPTNTPVGPFVPLDTTITPCNVGSNGAVACSCVDCADSCPAPLPPLPPSDPFRVAGVDGMAAVMFIVFVLGSLLFLGLVTLCPNLCAYTASLVSRNGGDSGRLSVGQSVGRRFAGMNQMQQPVFGDDEESPLQSKRSSTCPLTESLIHQHVSNS